jgi:ATP adenylyltransferase
LEPIQTREEAIDDGVSRWAVRVVDSLARKDYLRRALSGEGREAAAQERPSNPFLPYEEELYVSDINDSHVALLNKFKVIDNHLLIVTRRFADQQELLDVDDFRALQRCMREFKSLAFYNGGEEAGASQRHKHLQLVPLPLSSHFEGVPWSPAIPQGHDTGRIAEDSALPWVQGALSLAGWLEDPAGRDGAQQAYLFYRDLMDHIGVAPRDQSAGGPAGRPYNLLVTAERMWAVARSQEFHQGISINALGFAGALLARNDGQFNQLKNQGLMDILRAVGVERQDSTLES